MNEFDNVDPADYLVQVTGNKFRGDGILPEDWVVVHQQDTAEPGQLVMASINRTAELKHCEQGDRVIGVAVWVMGRRA